MTEAVDFLYRYRWVPWLCMGVLGVLAALPILYNDVAFWLRPVAVMHGTVVYSDPDAVYVRITGEKRRGVECVYLGIQAFGVRLAGAPVDMHIVRVDRLEDGKTKPQGKYDIGVWRIERVPDVVSVRVYTSHNCEGSRWATKVAEVDV